MNKRLLFFEKDTIIKKKGKFFPLYEKLGKLKNENVALNGGKNAASYAAISASNDKDILAFKREKQGKEVLFIGNVSGSAVKFSTNESGVYTDYISGKNVELKSEEENSLDPWQYWILVKE